VAPCRTWRARLTGGRWQPPTVGLSLVTSRWHCGHVHGRTRTQSGLPRWRDVPQYRERRLEPRCRTLASCTGVGTVSLWEVATGKLSCILHNPPNPNQIPLVCDHRKCVAFDSRGQALAAVVGPDLLIWNLSSMAVSRTIRLYPLNAQRPAPSLWRCQRCMGLAFSPDGRTVGTSFEAEGTMLWDLATGLRSPRLHR